MNNLYTISILMTNHKGLLSKAIRFFTGLGFAHTSIALNGENTYYSFNLKGFRKERPKQNKMNITKSLCYKIYVSEKEYDKILSHIDDFRSKENTLKYSRLGVVLCCLGIPHKFNDSYFCSQFIAELLDKSDVLKLRRSPSVYSPKKLEKIIKRQFRYMEVIASPI